MEIEYYAWLEDTGLDESVEIDDNTEIQENDDISSFFNLLWGESEFTITISCTLDWQTRTVGIDYEISKTKLDWENRKVALECEY